MFFKFLFFSFIFSIPYFLLWSIDLYRTMHFIVKCHSVKFLHQGFFDTRDSYISSFLYNSEKIRMNWIHNGTLVDNMKCYLFFPILFLDFIHVLTNGMLTRFFYCCSNCYFILFILKASCAILCRLFLV